jgi:hypothetical protein
MKIYSRVCHSLLVGFLLNFGFVFTAHALGGKMRSIVYQNHSSNWRVSHPKVVVAFGLMQDSLILHYSKYSIGYVQDRLNEINPNIEVQVISKANGQNLVDALMDRDTVGLIFISHSFKTKNTLATIMIGADGFAIPSNILSAATPALRFISFLGCHGPTISKQYEIDYQFKKPYGLKIFYEPMDTYLSTQLTWVDNVKKIIKKELNDMANRLSHTDLTRGREPDFDGDGRLSIQVKDVYPQIEPRYIRVNDQIVGVLGSDAEHSNSDTGYRNLSFRVPFYAFQDFNLTDEGGVQGTQPRCHDIRILGAELTPGVLVDNYLIQSITLEDPFGVRRRVYSPAWHLGDQEGPPKELGAPSPPDIGGFKKSKRIKILQDFQMKFFRHEEWIDHSAETWKVSPLKARFYSDCL